MLFWLNRNAPAVQAIASIASVCVTLMLAFVTYRYVQLTQSLCGGGERAAPLCSAIRPRLNSAQLLTLVDLLNGNVAKCPANERDGDKNSHDSPVGSSRS